MCRFICKDKRICLYNNQEFWNFEFLSLAFEAPIMLVFNVFQVSSFRNPSLHTLILLPRCILHPSLYFPVAVSAQTSLCLKSLPLSIYLIKLPSVLHSTSKYSFAFPKSSHVLFFFSLTLTCEGNIIKYY